MTYIGSESTAPADLHDAQGADARAIQRQLAAFHGHQDAKALEIAWPQLASDDRFIRYAARLAVESQPLDQWKDIALAETNPNAALTALLSLAQPRRQGRAAGAADRFVENLHDVAQRRAATG